MAVNLFSTVLALLAAFIFMANVMVFYTTKRKGVTWIFVIRYINNLTKTQLKYNLSCDVVL